MGLSRPTGSHVERLLTTLASRGFCMTPEAQRELADRAESMALDEIVDFVLVAEGFEDIAYVDKHLRAGLGNVVAEWLELG